ncbi:hypothetical protein [Legionella fallonii]|uniref:Transmembrane protein n=1 Tax=Legionella fallonii LLAP-10 TaxID=1212491 RepID=A0A098G3K3_9GAMM|nr:hypothetical protein [Legionella fallonii]CEG57052.1 conserved membrane protein of unknown function [Legionella fallonii LLAP-10]
MMRAGDFIIKQSKALLENKQHAILCAVILSMIPFASWLSVALVMLVTLRKGAKPGFEVMLPAVIMHAVPLIMMVPLEIAIMNTLFAYLPSYLAALSLRKTASWQMVFGVFFIQAFIGFTMIQLLAPDFIMEQFNQFKNLLTEYKEYQRLLDNNSDGLSSFIMAQLFLGIQILSVIVSAVISLLFARSIQSKLFIPGGFRDEVLAFRSGRLSFLVLMAISIASYYEIALAINLLPLVLCYFLISGFSLAYYILARKNQIRVAVLLLLLVLFKPSFVLLAYIVFGSLDSLFNFRLYLPERVREST